MRYYSSADKRLDKRDESACVAAWVSYALRGGDALAATFKFRKSILPAVLYTMRGRSVDHDCIRILDERNGLDSRGIGKAEEGDVGGIERVAPRRDILAQFLWKRDNLYVVARSEPFTNPQTCSSGRTVYENLFHFVMYIFAMSVL